MNLSRCLMGDGLATATIGLKQRFIKTSDEDRSKTYSWNRSQNLLNMVQLNHEIKLILRGGKRVKTHY